MADPHQDQPTQLGTDSARAGETPGVTRYVLAASLVLVIVAFIAIYFLH